MQWSRPCRPLQPHLLAHLHPEFQLPQNAGNNRSSYSYTHRPPRLSSAFLLGHRSPPPPQAGSVPSLCVFLPTESPVARKERCNYCAGLAPTQRSVRRAILLCRFQRSTATATMRPPRNSMLVSFMYWTHTWRGAGRPRQGCLLATYCLGPHPPKSPGTGKQTRY